MIKLPTKYEGDVIGWGPTRARWYSICSSLGCPGERDPGATHSRDCPRCMAGHYVLDISHAATSFFHDHFYRLWFWWVNRPNSKERRRLESIFPRLRGDDDSKQ